MNCRVCLFVGCFSRVANHLLTATRLANGTVVQLLDALDFAQRVRECSFEYGRMDVAQRLLLLFADTQLFEGG